MPFKFFYTFTKKINIMSDKNNPLNIEINDEVAQGTYSNLAVITHSSSEFIVDFVRIMPGMPKAQVKSRIILTPDHAKRLMLALQDNISKFESNHGTIKLADGGVPAFPVNFGGMSGEA